MIVMSYDTVKEYYTVSLDDYIIILRDRRKFFHGERREGRFVEGQGVEVRC